MINIHLHRINNELVVRVMRNEHLELVGTLVGVDQEAVEEKIISAIELALTTRDAAKV